MATSAFRSTSRRSTTTTTAKSSQTTTSPKNAPLRRSRSVSAFSRTQTDIPGDFSNKRDNPLFWSRDSKLDDAKLLVAEDSKLDSFGGDNRRGRSVSRNASTGVGRSLSRVGAGRRGRSVSKGRYITSESEAEEEGGVSTNYRNKKDLNLWSSNGRKANGLDQTKSVQISSTRARIFNDVDDSASSLDSKWEDLVWGVKETTIGAVSKQMKASCLGYDSTESEIYETVRSEVKCAIADIRAELEVAMRRSSADAIVNANVSDLPADLINAGAVELVLDVRNEYAKKLEQSQERARRLRADLAVEEHREKELSRILKEVLPEQKTQNVQKPRPRKKVSMEKRKMSKCLEEEAKAYFDECVSISTFDGSDFSSQEDPPFSFVGVTMPVVDSATVQPERTGLSASCCFSGCLTDKMESNQFEHTCDATGLGAGTSHMEFPSDKTSPSDPNTEQSRKCSLSENFNFQKDIKNYIRNFDKEFQADAAVSHPQRTTRYDMDDYGSRASAESLLFDRVFFRSAIESGSMLLCGGGISASCSPFAPIV